MLAVDEKENVPDAKVPAEKHADEKQQADGKVLDDYIDRILVDNDKKLTAVGHVHEAGDLHLAVVSVSPKSTGATVHKVLALLAVAGVAAAALRRRA